MLSLGIDFSGKSVRVCVSDLDKEEVIEEISSSFSINLASTLQEKISPKF